MGPMVILTRMRFMGSWMLWIWFWVEVGHRLFTATRKGQENDDQNYTGHWEGYKCRLGEKYGGGWWHSKLRLPDIPVSWGQFPISHFCPLLKSVPDMPPDFNKSAICLSFQFLLSSDIRSEGSIAIVKKFDFDFLWFFILHHSHCLKRALEKCLCVYVCLSSVWPSPNVPSKPIEQPRSNSKSRVVLQYLYSFLVFPYP